MGIYRNPSKIYGNPEQNLTKSGPFPGPPEIRDKTSQNLAHPRDRRKSRTKPHTTTRVLGWLVGWLVGCCCCWLLVVGCCWLLLVGWLVGWLLSTTHAEAPCGGNYDVPQLTGIQLKCKVYQCNPNKNKVYQCNPNKNYGVPLES